MWQESSSGGEFTQKFYRCHVTGWVLCSSGNILCPKSLHLGLLGKIVCDMLLLCDLVKGKNWVKIVNLVPREVRGSI